MHLVAVKWLNQFAQSDNISWQVLCSLNLQSLWLDLSPGQLAMVSTTARKSNSPHYMCLEIQTKSYQKVCVILLVIKAMGKEILQYLIFYQLRHKADFMLLEHVFVFAQNHLL